MIFGAKSDQGKVRDQNEDSFGIKECLFIVADGMGGHQAGEIASSVAVEKIMATVFSDAPVAQFLKEAICNANEAILQKVAANPELAGMGTTVAILLLHEGLAYVAHVGDSRVYRLVADGSLQRLTNDHSLVAELVKNGEITEEEAKNHPRRNILTRALGTKGETEMELGSFPAEPGDKFLLCSDGLTGFVDDNLIRDILLKKVHPQALAGELVDLANQNGGNDNITVIVAVIE